MESLATLHHRQQPRHLSLIHHRSSFPGPLSSVSFRTLQPRSSSRRPSSSLFKLLAIRASSSPSSPDPVEPKSHLFQTLSSRFAPIVRTTCITVAAAAFFFMRLQHKPVIAAPVAPSTVESTEESAENISLEEKERIIEEQLSNDPNDTEALRSLMEVRIRAQKLGEAIQVIERLIELEPDEFEWPLLKAHMHIYNGDLELAKNGFEEILTKDPYRVEAYHGLVMATSETNGSIKGLVKRVEEATELCKKHKNKSDVRDFKLLLAQIKVMEGDYFDALKVYQELVKEEPRDFRPYLCQGIIYTLLRKKDEAEKQFQKFRRLVPKNHPYKEYFEDNMFATKFFSQKVEMERAGSKS
ncbi:Protein SLOW GREEN 1 chloroplastic-like [Quillaja saponaria]|uniref:Protein SLOW GREEN 1 chloroplastic-like n=1 Tax=Quillaja saponaria TaxID=32244 RepID=A0AAD7Q904_QUISA|nr:Protein SLOW GREEN 1 chloroplastic-like [Quillaja saponaria]